MHPLIIRDGFGIWGKFWKKFFWRKGVLTTTSDESVVMAMEIEGWLSLKEGEGEELDFGKYWFVIQDDIIKYFFDREV